MTGADGPSLTAGQANELVVDALDVRLAPALEALAGADGCSDVDLDGRGFDYTMDFSHRLEPGEEAEVCRIDQIGPAPIFLQSSDVRLTQGSHHGIVWLTEYDALPTETLSGHPVRLGETIPCENGPRALFELTAAVAGGQGRGNVTADGHMPPGVVIEIPANTFVVSNFHMLNVTDRTLDACMKVGLAGVPEADVEHEAGVFLFYNPFITIGPMGTSTARMACPLKQDVELVTAVSHMHARGDRYVADLLSGDPYAPETTVVRTLFETREWEEPERSIFAPPLSVPSGSWIDFRCEYVNPDLVPVVQGLEQDDEMCMFLGIYYPRNDDLSFCLEQSESGSRRVGSAGYQIGEGTMDGPAFMECLWSSPLDFSVCGSSECASPAGRWATQRCFTEACESVGQHSRPYVNCIADHQGACTSECTDAEAQFTVVCAGSPDAQGGCADSFGSDGTDGTCAGSAGVRDHGIAVCSSDVRRRAIDAACDVACLECRGGDEEACDACKGQIDFEPTNDGCRNTQALLCLHEEIAEAATECVEECFVPCVERLVRACAVECLNEDTCNVEYDSIMETTCD